MVEADKLEILLLLGSLVDMGEVVMVPG